MNFLAEGQKQLESTSRLVFTFVWAIELVVAGTLPGLACLGPLVVRYPAVGSGFHALSYLGGLRLALILLWATVVGFMLGNLGHLMLVAVSRFQKFGEETDNAFWDAHSSARLFSKDFQQFLKALTPEEREKYTGLTGDEIGRFHQEVFARIKATSREELQRRMHSGISLIPFVMSIGSEPLRHQMRMFISGPDTIFAFCRAVLPLTLLPGILMFTPGMTLNLQCQVLAIFATALAFCLWVNVTIGSYIYYRAAQLAQWIGISYLEEARKILDARE